MVKIIKGCDQGGGLMFGYSNSSLIVKQKKKEIPYVFLVLMFIILTH